MISPLDQTLPRTLGDETGLLFIKAWLQRQRGLLLILLVAVLAMAPELATGLTVTDNFRFNLTWPEQFMELFRGGILYPRWLPRCWGGMGSPVFYFYPPLFFWVTSLVDALTGSSLPSERLVPVASTIMLAISGVSMRAWLSSRTAGLRPTLAAVGYMLAPYHLYDLYGRGALAEVSAYASIPVVMLALARLGEGRKHFVAVLAIAFAALLFSHLPIALLTSLFLIAPFVGFTALRSREPIRFVALALVGGLIGLMLAAVYVLPALSLLPNVSPSALSGSFYRPENWFFWHINAGIMGGRMLLIIPISIASLLFATGLAIAGQVDALRRELYFWATLTIFLVVLVAGLIPVVWKIPGLVLVQFPWRALLLVEFTTITLVAIVPLPKRNFLVLSGTAMLGFGYLVLAMVGWHMIGRTWSGGRQTAAEIRADYRDAPEYLPAGTRIEQGTGPDDVRVVLPQIPLASAADHRAKLVASEGAAGSMAISVNTPAATTVVLRRFYFPHWQLHDGTGHQIALVPNSQVVTFVAPAGNSTFRLENGEAPYEALARGITLLAVAVLALIAAGEFRSRGRSRLLGELKDIKTIHAQI